MVKTVLNTYLCVHLPSKSTFQFVLFVFWRICFFDLHLFYVYDDSACANGAVAVFEVKTSIGEGRFVQVKDGYGISDMLPTMVPKEVESGCKWRLVKQLIIVTGPEPIRFHRQPICSTPTAAQAHKQNTSEYTCHMYSNANIMSSSAELGERVREREGERDTYIDRKINR